MSTEQAADLAIEHPAPQRHKAHPLWLAFSLIGGPAAWLTQLLFAFAVTSYVCLDPARFAVWASPAIIVLNLLALAVIIAALLTAANLFRLTSRERDDAARQLVDIGEGRTRFLAIWGICVSAVFLIATLANVPSLFLVRLCGP